MMRRDGWERAVHAQPFTWTADGFPEFGAAIAPGAALPVPSGQHGYELGGRFTDNFDDARWDRWTFYGWNGFITAARQELSLGWPAAVERVNDFRSGEKALVRGRQWGDAVFSTRLRNEKGGRESGILFRVCQPAVGYDALKGYFASISDGDDRLVLSRCDGAKWEELARADRAISPGQWYTLQIAACGPEMRVSLDGSELIVVCDSTYTSGLAGVRVADTQTLFDDFAVSAEHTAR
jgi:hypothetical protein